VQATFADAEDHTVFQSRTIGPNDIIELTAEMKFEDTDGELRPTTIKLRLVETAGRPARPELALLPHGTRPIGGSTAGRTVQVEVSGPRLGPATTAPVVASAPGQPRMLRIAPVLRLLQKGK